MWVNILLITKLGIVSRKNRPSAGFFTPKIYQTPLLPPSGGFFIGVEMDSATLSIVLSIVAGSASIIWQASRIKSNVDTHGNAIGELKRRLDANDKAICDHHGRISKLEGRDV